MINRVFITDMSCNHCVMSVRDTLKKLEGITSVSVDLETGVATVDSEMEISFETYEKAVAGAGYSVGAVE